MELKAKLRESSDTSRSVFVASIHFTDPFSRRMVDGPPRSPVIITQARGFSTSGSESDWALMNNDSSKYQLIGSFEVISSMSC
jgi:hypothetical protein